MCVCVCGLPAHLMIKNKKLRVVSYYQALFFVIDDILQYCSAFFVLSTVKILQLGGTNVIKF